jgi:hypothetical protein
MPVSVIPHLLFVDYLIKIDYLYLSKSIHLPAGTQEASASPYQRPICSKAGVSYTKSDVEMVYACLLGLCTAWPGSVTMCSL